MKTFLEDHLWGLIILTIAVVTAYTVMVLAGYGEQGTLLRSAILTLVGAVAGYAQGKRT